MSEKINNYRNLRSRWVRVIFIGIIATQGCKSISDDVSLDDHLANLMNNRKYDEVIGTIDSLKEPQKSKPEYLIYRAQAFCGKSGFDLVSLTKIATKAMNFNELERSFSRLLKSDNSSTSISQKTSINTVRSFVSFAGYMKIMDYFPDLQASARPLLMEGLLTLQKVPEDSEASFRKARSQSFMLHSVIMLASVKKSIRQNLQQNDPLDMFCMIDGTKFASEFLWMMDHLSGALDDAEILKRKAEGTNYQPGQLAKIQQKTKEFMANPSNMSPNVLSSEIMAVQGIQCTQ